MWRRTLRPSRRNSPLLSGGRDSSAFGRAPGDAAIGVADDQAGGRADFDAHVSLGIVEQQFRARCTAAQRGLRLTLWIHKKKAGTANFGGREGLGVCDRDGAVGGIASGEGACNDEKAIREVTGSTHGRNSPWLVDVWAARRSQKSRDFFSETPAPCRSGLTLLLVFLSPLLIGVFRC